MEYKVIYPLKYLLRNPNLFYAISEQLGGFIDPKELYEFFFQFYSESLESSNVEGDIREHIPDQVMFEASQSEDESKFQVNIIFNNGDGCILTGEAKDTTGIVDEGDLQRASYIYHSIVNNLERVCPEHVGDIYLVDPPSPVNDYLQHPDGSGDIVGLMGLHSDPKKKFRFRLTCGEGQNTEITLYPS